MERKRKNEGCKTMMPEKAKKAKFFFLAVYALFGIMLIYLFLFNTGLAIEEKFNEENGQKEIYLKNTTDRQINNVTVKYREEEGEPKDLNMFASLAPNEEQRIYTGSISANQATIIVQSPFHSTIEKLVVLRAKQEITLTMSFPSDILFGKSFAFSVEACNNTATEKQVKIAENHEKGFFSEPNKTDTITLKAVECKQIDYSLIPIQKGGTTIYFNLNTENNVDQFQQTVTVQ
ncbi:MAG: hypothetical protein AABW99_00275 [archaeon]